MTHEEQRELGSVRSLRPDTRAGIHRDRRWEERKALAIRILIAVAFAVVFGLAASAF